jgi:hypothetical protein
MVLSATAEQVAIAVANGEERTSADAPKTTFLTDTVEKVDLLIGVMSFGVF